MFGGRVHAPFANVDRWFVADDSCGDSLCGRAGADGRIGLLNRRPWGRTVAIIVAILALVKFPFGTALGIYTLWVLAPGASGLEYDAIADRS